MNDLDAIWYSFKFACFGTGGLLLFLALLCALANGIERVE
jgi:hypothetical protein